MATRCSTRRDVLGTAALCAGGVLLARSAPAEGAEQSTVASYNTPKPAFRKGSTILFQGDSITHGGRGRDLNHYMGHCYAYLIAARLGASGVHDVGGRDHRRIAAAGDLRGHELAG